VQTNLETASLHLWSFLLQVQPLVILLLLTLVKEGLSCQYILHELISSILGLDWFRCHTTHRKLLMYLLVGLEYNFFRLDTILSKLNAWLILYFSLINNF